MANDGFFAAPSSGQEKYPTKFLRRLDQQVYHPSKSFSSRYIRVDSKRFVEMFFVAGSIP